MNDYFWNFRRLADQRCEEVVPCSMLKPFVSYRTGALRADPWGTAGHFWDRGASGVLPGFFRGASGALPGHPGAPGLAEVRSTRRGPKPGRRRGNNKNEPTHRGCSPRHAMQDPILKATNKICHAKMHPPTQLTSRLGPPRAPAKLGLPTVAVGGRTRRARAS